MTAVSAPASVLAALDPATYVPHRLHDPSRNYVENNCYVDGAIELLHALGEEPVALLAFIARTQWEGDQFTYAKPPLADIQALYGIEVHEMLPWRPIPDHIAEQLRRGRTVIMEADTWFLPDTAGIGYRSGHIKTTIIPSSVDQAAERMVYFHNAGLWELSGEDYRGVFHQLPQFDEWTPDPYLELMDLSYAPALRGEELRAAARELLCHYHARRPAENPFRAWGETLPAELERLSGADTEAFHDYAFVTVRMAGSAFELMADHVEYVFGGEAADLGATFRAITESTKAFGFRLARRRPFDVGAALSPLVEGWEAGMERLGQLLA